MARRKIADVVEKRPYFEAAPVDSSVTEEGTRDMGVQYPFLICGGRNTERYYFTHINDTTNYKFNIRPKYFGDEANYTEAFPPRIREILKDNNDAKIFCVFDWDTIYGQEVNLNKHKAFERLFEAEISNGMVVVCPSMPSIEYWFLLHFADDDRFYKSYGSIAGVLAPHLKPYFVDPSKPFKKLLKSEKHLKDATWVMNLCAAGKLDLAIQRAEKNIKAAIASDELDRHAYSYVYKVFKER